MYWLTLLFYWPIQPHTLYVYTYQMAPWLQESFWCARRGKVPSTNTPVYIREMRRVGSKCCKMLSQSFHSRSKFPPFTLLAIYAERVVCLRRSPSLESVRTSHHLYMCVCACSKMWCTVVLILPLGFDRTPKAATHSAYMAGVWVPSAWSVPLVVATVISMDRGPNRS